MFKQAHLFCKTLVIEAAGKKAAASNVHWEFNPELLESVQDNRWSEMLRHLRQLVVANDNMANIIRGEMDTYAEVLKNLDWMVIMSIHAVEVRYPLPTLHSPRPSLIPSSMPCLPAPLSPTSCCCTPSIRPT